MCVCRLGIYGKEVALSSLQVVVLRPHIDPCLVKCSGHSMFECPRPFDRSVRICRRHAALDPRALTRSSSAWVIMISS